MRPSTAVEVVEKKSPTQFAFGTKAETLERLAWAMGGHHFCEQMYFTVREWRGAPERISEAILARFGARKLAVRSSSCMEDTSEVSLAGAYTSVLGVRPDGGAIRDAVAQVIDSYGDHADEDHVLVQEMVESVAVAGVLFTRDIEAGSEYYVINYDDFSGKTDTVTAGGQGKIIHIRRGSESRLKSERFRALLGLAKRIEALTNDVPLDIEFCIEPDDHVHILQVRRLVLRRTTAADTEVAVNATLAQVELEVREHLARKSTVAGETSVFSEMADWNPAELIGNTPSPLALSLYKRLVTDSTWARARAAMGYRSMVGQPLLRSFGGHPYIDVRLSLNSFLPATLPGAIAEKLVDYQIGKLQEKRSLHDKIEFDVAVTTYDFSMEGRREELLLAGLSSEELAIFEGELKALTLSLLTRGAEAIERELGTTALLDRDMAQAASLPPRTRALFLLERLIDHGTLPFAVLARHAFIATTLLRSLTEAGWIGEDDVSDYLAGVHTVTSRFVDDVRAFSTGALDRPVLLERYGFLRPGTYDICSLRYDEAPDVYFGRSVPASRSREEFRLSGSARAQIDLACSRFGLPYGADGLLAYISSAIAAREESKFRFTKVLSRALVDLGEWGASLGLTREDVRYLDIEQIADAGDAAALCELIASARRDRKISRALRLPTVLCSPEEAKVAVTTMQLPTFIGATKVTGISVYLDGFGALDVSGKIVVIENADPGYDWVFSYDIIALVTKYGGANSHMAVRCSELGLPAAIGCGERIFSSLAGNRLIELDCKARRVKAVT